jgi:hypothetical protein
MSDLAKVGDIPTMYLLKHVHVMASVNVMKQNRVGKRVTNGQHASRPKNLKISGQNAVVPYE